MRRTVAWVGCAFLLLALPSAVGAAGAGPESGGDPPFEGANAGEAPLIDGAGNRLEPLVPEIAADPYGLEPGVRKYLHRLSFSPGYGNLGSERLFAFQVAYNPNPWLGYEGSIGHNPGQSVHAVLHTITAIVRRPLTGRFQPYLCGGYGMIMVYPGPSLNADPVTKNALAIGGGIEFFIRSDLALRADLRNATVFGSERDRDDLVAYQYLQQTLGLSFYRTIRP
jgi:hypothetical protein